MPLNFNIPFSDSSKYNYNENVIEVKNDIAGLVKKNIPPEYNELVGYYNFNDDLLKDSSLNNKNVTVRGNAELNSAGILGNCLSISGIEDGVVLPNNFPLDINKPFSFTFWFNPKSFNRFEKTLVSKGNGSNDNSSFSVRLLGDTLYFDVYDILNDSWNNTTMTGLEKNQWYYVAFTYDGSNVYFYINNYPYECKIENGFSSSTYDIVIGNLGNFSAGFDGLIDEVMFYNRFLSESDVNEIYNKTKSGERYLPKYVPYDAGTYTITTLKQYDDNLDEFSSFNVTEGANSEGDILYQLSADGSNWLYWDGSNWVPGDTYESSDALGGVNTSTIQVGPSSGSFMIITIPDTDTTSTTDSSNVEIQANTEEVINENIWLFPTKLKSIFVRAFMTTDGHQDVEIDNIDIEYLPPNVLPIVDAGSDKSCLNREEIKPFSDASFSDPDGTIVDAEFWVDGESDTWLNIGDSGSGTVLENVRNFPYQFNNAGEVTVRLSVLDDREGYKTDTLKVNVDKFTSAFNIKDSAGNDLSDVLFVPDAGESSRYVSSPFQYDIGNGSHKLVFQKPGYAYKEVTVDVTKNNQSFNIVMEEDPNYKLITVPFNEPINYTYDNSEIEVINSKAQLTGSPSTLGNGLIGYWRYEETDTMEQPNSFKDLSSYGNDAIVNPSSDISVSGGKIGNTADFTNVYTILEIPDNGVFTSNNNITVATWFKLDKKASLTGLKYLVSKYTNTNPINENQCSFSLFLSDGYLTFDVQSKGYKGGDVSEVTGESVGSSTTVNVDQWYFAVGVYDYTNGSLKLYLDGDLKREKSYNGIIFDSNIPVTIGGIREDDNDYFANEDYNGYFNGLIDETVIYNRPLTDAEITEIYNNGDGKYISSYSNNSPTIFRTAGNTSLNVSEYTHFSITKGDNHEGDLGFQLSTDGTNWLFYDDSYILNPDDNGWYPINTADYEEVGYNTVYEINKNLATFPTTDKAIYVRTLLLSDGKKQASIDEIQIGYTYENQPPSLFAGNDKTCNDEDTIKPFGDATFSDPDGTVTQAFYKIPGEVDTWTEITVDSNTNLLEEVQNFEYNFSNPGIVEISLRVYDDGGNQVTDSLSVTVNKYSVTFNVIDSLTGNHLTGITFDPGDGTGIRILDSPFTHEYETGSYDVTLEKPLYFTQNTTVNVPDENQVSVSLVDGSVTKFLIPFTNSSQYTYDSSKIEVVDGKASLIFSSYMDGLMGYWKFDKDSYDGTAGEVVDSSGNNNNGYYVFEDGSTTSLASTTGLIGNAGILNEAGYIDLGNDSTLDLTSDMTVSIWIKVNTLPDSKTKIISNKGSWHIEVNGSDLKYYAEGGSNPLLATGVITAGEWHYVVVERDTVNSEQTLFVDNVLQSTQPLDTVNTIAEGIRLGEGVQGTSSGSTYAYFAKANEGLYKYDASGTEQWFYSISSEQPRISNVYSDGSVLLNDQEYETFYMINSDGTLRWTKTFNDISFVNTQNNGVIYFSNNTDYKLIALDIVDGSIIWTYEAPNRIYYPHYKDGKIYAVITLSTWRFRCIDASDGSELWNEINDELKPPGQYVGANKFTEDYMYLEDEPYLSRININDGTSESIVNVSEYIYAIYAISDSEIYVTGDSDSYAVKKIDGNSGTISWISSAFDNGINEKELDFDSNGDIYAGSGNTFKKLKRSDGSVLWSLDTTSSDGDSIIRVKVFRDHVYILAQNKLYVYDFTGTEYYTYAFTDADANDFRILADGSVVINVSDYDSTYSNYTTGIIFLDSNGNELFNNVTTQTTRGYSSGYSDMPPTIYLDGNVDELSLYNRTLSVSEINELYNSGNGKEIPKLPTTPQPIFKTEGDSHEFIDSYSHFTVTEGANNQGSLGYQLSVDGMNWLYWDGSAWSPVTANEYNTATAVDNNIDTFPATEQSIYVKTFLISDGTKEVEIDEIEIGFNKTNQPATLNAGSNKSCYVNGTVSPFSDAYFSDPDGNVLFIYYKIEGVVDTWTEITQGSYATLLEAVQSFSYQCGSSGDYTFRLQAHDDDGALTESSLIVAVNDYNVTFNVTDSLTGNHMTDIAFDPGNGTDIKTVDSPFTIGYESGSYIISLSKSGYVTQTPTINVTSDGQVVDIQLSEPNSAPSVSSGTNMTVKQGDMIKPFSESTFSDDGNIMFAYYLVEGEVDNWTNIPQETYTSLLEAVQNYQYQFNNIGTKTIKLKVEDDKGVTSTDSHTVTVEEHQITFNVTDAETGSHVESFMFTPDDKANTVILSSPFTWKYEVGSHNVIIQKGDYLVDSSTIVIPDDDNTVSITLSRVSSGDGSSGTGGITDQDIQNLVNAIWDEPISNHITEGTFGSESNKIKKILGLSQSNYKLINPIYDSDGNMTSATIRIYKTASDCNNDLSPINEYSVIATYDTDGSMQTYKVVETV